MATRIRLQRHGRKGRPIFTIVIADSRSKRDGRYIQKIGQYNPNTNPASIELDFESALSWLQKGAVPSDTARAILSYEGVMMKKHLLEGVKKGAHTEADVEAKFAAWLDSKQGKIDKSITGIAANADKLKAERMKAEAEKNATRAAAIAAALLVPEVEEATEEDICEVNINIDDITMDISNIKSPEVKITDKTFIYEHYNLSLRSICKKHYGYV